MNEINTQTPINQGNVCPDLTLKQATLDNLAAVLAPGWELKHHEYPEVSAMLASDKGGFFDKSRYPDTNK